MLAPAGAVVVVIAVILALIWINGHPTGGSSSAIALTTHSAAPPVLVTSATPTSAPPTTSSPDPTPTTPASPKHPPTKKPSAHPSKPPPPAVLNAMAPLQVLNNSRIHGLAHQVAAEVEAKGWHVGVIGNLQGRTPVPTVYFSPGNEAAAKHLAREFSSIQRIEPNSAAGLTATGLTLVLTSGWAD